jgi:hypothetical protein
MHPIEEAILFLLNEAAKHAVDPHTHATAKRLIAGIAPVLPEDEAEQKKADA